MEALYLNSNSLQGTVPSVYGNLAELAVLYLNNNQLKGTIPPELGFLLNILTMDVSDNSLSASLPSTFTHWTLLQYLNLSFNEFTGPSDVLASKNFSFLQVVDLSNNHFSGTIPESLFVPPSLLTIIGSQNCFSGSLPSSICSLEGLENIVLDLLTGNCASSGRSVGGFVLRHYMIGTIPSCIWNSSSIRILHLLGNGLTGSLADLSNASTLSVVGLGSNQLTGTIPTSFQHRNFAQLDLSINRFSGTLVSDLRISDVATVYDISVNRLSGVIPKALYGSFEAGTINILEGNLFGCQQDDIPSSDPNHAAYQCGSVGFEEALLTWFIVVGAIAATMVVMTLSGVDSTRQLFIMIISSLLFDMLLAGPVCCLAVSVLGLSVFILVKLLRTNVITSTHAVQYWWTSTAVFVNNWLICVFVFLLLAASSAVFTVTVMSLPRTKTELKPMLLQFQLRLSAYSSY
jgi:Leucine-rich repeat (LRR) protein